MVDRTKSKLGKGRSWLLRMCIPFGITTMLLFFVPQNFPEMAQYVYIFLMYNIVNVVCLTGMLVPYYSMISLVTANPYERGFLGNVQQIFQTLGNFCVFSTKERVHSADSADESDQKSASAGREAGTWETVKALLKNKYWVIITIASFVVFFVIIMYR